MCVATTCRRCAAETDTTPSTMRQPPSSPDFDQAMTSSQGTTGTRRDELATAVAPVKVATARIVNAPAIRMGLLASTPLGPPRFPLDRLERSARRKGTSPAEPRRGAPRVLPYSSALLSERRNAGYRSP